MAAEQRSPDRWNLCDLDLAPTRAHQGEGEIGVVRVAHAEALSGACNFIDHVAMPPGTSIGRHRHAADEEEFYLVLGGEGRMWRDGEEFPVRAGDLIRNPPSAEHGLVNTGAGALRLFVFEVRVP
jgi:mannose-6-phosphate isomerase-like protein (cupin superfamily)